MDKLLTVIIDHSDDAHELKTSIERQLLKYTAFIDIVLCSNMNKQVNSYLSMSKESIDSIIELANSEYVVVLNSSQQVDIQFVRALIKALDGKSIWYSVIPTVKTIQEGAKIIKDMKPIETQRSLLRMENTMYGVVYNRHFLLSVLNQTPYGMSTLINFLKMYNIQKIFLLPTYIISNAEVKDSGYFGRFTLDTFQTLDMPINTAADSLFFNELILNTRFFRLHRDVMHGTINNAIQDSIATMDILKFEKYITPANELDYYILKCFITGQVQKYLFKTTLTHNIYITISLEALVLKEETPVYMYEMNFGDKKIYIYRLYEKISTNKITTYKEFSQVDFYTPLNEQSLFLFMDRTMKADDNAEHLYRYMMQNQKQYKHAYFVLDRNSQDWYRLKKEGFNLIDYKSPAFQQYFKNCDVFISSQAYSFSQKIHDVQKSFKNSRFVYLQHGIMLNDMTDWILSKPVDLFITTGEKEYQYVKELLPLETRNTGIPRLDNLVKKESTGIISFLPTWRFSLMKVTEQQFKRSKYYKSIVNMIQNTELNAYLENTNQKIYIKMHPNFANRISLFPETENIVFTDLSYNELITGSQFVFTDYSSVVLDAAYIETPIAYYQFDKDEIFKVQVFKERVRYEDGLGPVFEEEEKMIHYITTGNFLIEDEIYAKRKNDFFAGVHRDYICESIWNEIVKI
ncbi:MAG: CDP-glycerol glycerophosphotransferase family protein [Culicoidibacterales bacterium]